MNADGSTYEVPASHELDVKVDFDAEACERQLKPLAADTLTRAAVNAKILRLEQIRDAEDRMLMGALSVDVLNTAIAQLDEYYTASLERKDYAFTVQFPEMDLANSTAMAARIQGSDYRGNPVDFTVAFNLKAGTSGEGQNAQPVAMQTVSLNLVKGSYTVSLLMPVSKPTQKTQDIIGEDGTVTKQPVVDDAGNPVMNLAGMYGPAFSVRSFKFVDKTYSVATIDGVKYDLTLVTPEAGEGETPEDPYYTYLKDGVATRVPDGAAITQEVRNEFSTDDYDEATDQTTLPLREVAVNGASQNMALVVAMDESSKSQEVIDGYFDTLTQWIDKADKNAYQLPAGSPVIDFDRSIVNQSSQYLPDVPVEYSLYVDCEGWWYQLKRRHQFHPGYRAYQPARTLRGNVVDKYVAFEANNQVFLNLYKGNYTVSYITPVNSDGSLYRMPADHPLLLSSDAAAKTPKSATMVLFEDLERGENAVLLPNFYDAIDAIPAGGLTDLTGLVLDPTEFRTTAQKHMADALKRLNDSKVSIGNSSNPYAFAYTGTYVDRTLENFGNATGHHQTAPTRRPLPRPPPTRPRRTASGTIPPPPPSTRRATATTRCCTTTSSPWWKRRWRLKTPTTTRCAATTRIPRRATRCVIAWACWRPRTCAARSWRRPTPMLPARAATGSSPTIRTIAGRTTLRASVRTAKPPISPTASCTRAITWSTP